MFAGGKNLQLAYEIAWLVRKNNETAIQRPSKPLKQHESFQSSHKMYNISWRL